VLVQRENYLYQELNILSKTLSNIHLTNKRYPTTWGSSTLLTAHLEAFKQIFEELKWNFSFILNLSESDFPLKPIQVLTNFLSTYTSYNFLRSHNREPFKYVFFTRLFSSYFLLSLKILSISRNASYIYSV
jgi:protein xylosyltransferase